MTVLAVHALLFAVVWHFTHKMIWRMTEGFQKATRVQPAAKATREQPAAKATREQPAATARR
jgi:hypothetical protein